MKMMILQKQKRKEGFLDSILPWFWLKLLTFHVEIAVEIGWSWAIEDSDSSITKLFICINVNIHFFTVQKLKGKEEIQATWVLLVTGRLERINKAREVTWLKGAKLHTLPLQKKKQYSKTRGLTAYPLMPKARVSRPWNFHTRKESYIWQWTWLENFTYLQ